MKRYHGIESASQIYKQTAITIGNFDGVHIGHQALLHRLLEHETLMPVVICFNPTPRAYFTKQTLPSLMSFEDKCSIFEAMGVEAVICIPFQESIANIMPEAFVKNILVQQFNMRHWVMGDDYRFGRNRQGDVACIHAMSQALNFDVTVQDACLIDGVRASSTEVKRALMASHFNLASKLLGRRYTISGLVTEGQKRGRKLGFPTANLPLGDFLPPISGVFAVQVRHQRNIYSAIANLGVRPTVDGYHRILEVHLLDETIDLYQEKIEVGFLHKIREEKKFASLDELKTQIKLDVNQVKRYFEKNLAAVI